MKLITSKQLTSLFTGLCLTLMFVPAARALDNDGESRLSFRGFGTLGIACFSAKGYDYEREERPDGPGKSRTCDAKLGSTLGVQVDATLSENVQATLQATSYHRADDSFTPEVTLANLSWNLGDGVGIRAGRMQWPMFLASEYRNVLFAQPWVRPPVEMYNRASAYSIDGIELNKHTNFGDWAAEFYGGVAHSGFDIARVDGTDDTDQLSTNFAYLNARFKRGDWQFNGGLMGGNVSYANPQLNAALSLLSTNLAKELENEDKSLFFLTLGTRYENDLWLLQSEFMYRSNDSLYRDQYAAYLMAGRNFGKWMPYTILSRGWSESQGKEDKATTPFEHNLAKTLVNFTKKDRTSFSLGLSHTLSEKAILKLQAEWIKPDGGTVVPGALEHMLTINLDFIF
ncbi:MAG: hypothetical protein ACKVN9_02010 [Methylophilaceae bacterium]